MTMRPLPLILLPVLLAACSTLGLEARREAPPDPPLTPAHAACREEARSAPDVRAAARAMNMNNPANLQRINYDMRVAELRAYRECLRRNGLAAPGGVEAQRSL